MSDDKLSDDDTPQDALDEGSDASPAPLNLLEFFSSQDREDESEYSLLATSEEYPGLLETAAETYRRTHSFVEGQLVQWKPMMRNLPRPLESTPAVVVRIGQELAPARPLGTAARVEPADMVIGVLDGNQIFKLYAVTSARFMPWEP